MASSNLIYSAFNFLKGAGNTWTLYQSNQRWSNSFLGCNFSGSCWGAKKPQSRQQTMTQNNMGVGMMGIHQVDWLLLENTESKEQIDIETSSQKKGWGGNKKADVEESNKGVANSRKSKEGLNSKSTEGLNSKEIHYQSTGLFPIPHPCLPWDSSQGDLIAGVPCCFWTDF